MMDSSIRSFLAFMQISPVRSRYGAGEHLRQLLLILESQSSSLNFELFSAENLMKCLYSNQVALSNANVQCFVKVIRLLWEFEDQGIIASSSLINDLGVRTLLETCRDVRSRSSVISALQHMFVTATKHNKRVLVDTVLWGVTTPEHADMLDIWEHAIVGSIGKSSMRMEVVSSSLAEMCNNDHVVGTNPTNLLHCIKSAAGPMLCDWNKINATIIKKVRTSDEKTSIFYVRFLHALVGIQNVNPVYHINEFVSILKGLRKPRIDLQCAIYEAIEDLKRTSADIYQDSLIQIFSEDWISSK